MCGLPHCFLVFSIIADAHTINPNAQSAKQYPAWEVPPFTEYETLVNEAGNMSLIGE